MAEFTKGNWKIDEGNSGEDEIKIISHQPLTPGFGLRAIALVPGGENNPQGKANALLITAAPDLYEAIRMVLKRLERDAGEPGVASLGKKLSPILTEAINKAEGTQ